MNDKTLFNGSSKKSIVACGGNNKDNKFLGMFAALKDSLKNDVVVCRLVANR